MFSWLIYTFLQPFYWCGLFKIEFKISTFCLRWYFIGENGKNLISIAETLIFEHALHLTFITISKLKHPANICAFSRKWTLFSHICPTIEVFFKSLKKKLWVYEWTSHLQKKIQHKKLPRFIKTPISCSRHKTTLDASIKIMLVVLQTIVLV